EILYAELSLALRAGYHALLADARVARDGLADLEEPTGEPAHFVALHHFRGPTPRAAKRYLQPALDHLSSAYRRDAEVELLLVALTSEELLSDKERCEMLIRKGITHRGLGQRAEEGDALREAVQLADAEADEALRSKARIGLGWHLWALGQYPEAQATYEEAIEIARAAGDEQAEERAAAQLGSVFSTLGYQEKALERVKYENNRGIALQYLGRYAEALACFEKHVKVEKEKGDRRTWGIGLVNLGRLQAALGDPDSGRATLEESRSLLRAIGQRRPESYALHRLGVVEEQVGDFDGAERLYERALAVRREMQYASGVAETLLAFGRLRLAQGRAQEAIRLLSEAQGVSREIDRPDEIALSGAYLGDTVAAEDALAFYGERMRVAEAMEVRFVLWRAKRRRGHLEEAHRLLCHLRDHSPESYRDTLVANVPLHRDLMRAWEEHGEKG
ncbi:MAG: tetratricopeptide repeat protein, partial [Planctomycetota bacterium]